MEAACPTYVDWYEKAVVSGTFPSELNQAVNPSALARGAAMAARETLHLKSTSDTSFFSL